MMGVDYDLFWTLNPKSLDPFIKAFSMKQKYDNICSWRDGMYIRMAVASVLDSSVKYPTSPIEADKELTPAEKSLEIRKKVMERMIVINSRFKEDVKK